MGEVKLTQKNALAYLKRQTEPRSVTDIRFLLDAGHGNVYPPSHVLRVLRGLERKGEARRLVFGYWEYKEARSEQKASED